MPVLPKVCLRLSFPLFILIACYLSLISPIFAAPGPPNPQPCQNALDTNKLTANYITDQNGEAPIVRQITANGSLNQSATISVNETFQVDFSKLQSLFAAPNSNYLEGNFQDSAHTLDGITNLNSQDFNTFHGAGQKAAPKVMVDGLKKNYVQYVYNKPTLPEAANKYTDVDGNGTPKTVYDLVSDFGLPNPPEPGTDQTVWLQTWGKYWEKIPTAYTEFFFGQLQFRLAAGETQFQLIQNGQSCPLPIRTIKFVLPEFSRTTSITDQLNQVIIPCSAQSYRQGDSADANDCGQPPTTAQNPNPNGNSLSSVISFCKKLIADSTKGFSLALRKIIQTSMRLNPIKQAYAADDTPTCIKVIEGAKNGQAPYCALPQDQLAPGDSCTNPYGNDPNKLDQNNQNVVCTFHLAWQIQKTIGPVDPNSANRQPDSFDACTSTGGNNFSCTITFKIWPVFLIPYLAEIWNNTLYSDNAESARVNSYQETGRPGIYSVFTPQALRPIYTNLTNQQILNLCNSTNGQDPLCQQLGDLFTQCLNSGISFGNCIIETLNLAASSKSSTSSDPKESFMGGTSNSRDFVKDCALKPLALQHELGVQNHCNQATSSASP